MKRNIIIGIILTIAMIICFAVFCHYKNQPAPPARCVVSSFNHKKYTTRSDQQIHVTLQNTDDAQCPIQGISFYIDLLKQKLHHTVVFDKNNETWNVHLKESNDNALTINLRNPKRTISLKLHLRSPKFNSNNPERIEYYAFSISKLNYKKVQRLKSTFELLLPYPIKLRQS